MGKALESHSKDTSYRLRLFTVFFHSFRNLLAVFTSINSSAKIPLRGTRFLTAYNGDQSPNTPRPEMMVASALIGATRGLRLGTNFILPTYWCVLLENLVSLHQPDKRSVFPTHLVVAAALKWQPRNRRVNSTTDKKRLRDNEKNWRCLRECGKWSYGRLLTFWVLANSLSLALRLCSKLS